MMVALDFLKGGRLYLLLAHGPGAHDDIANSVAGALVRAFARTSVSWRDVEHLPRYATVGHMQAKRGRSAPSPRRLIDSVLAPPRDVTSEAFELDRMARTESAPPKSPRFARR